MSTLQATLRLTSLASNSTFAIGGPPYFAPETFSVVHGFLHDWISHLDSVLVDEMKDYYTGSKCEG